MKILIVDDEKHVRDAIRLLINWEDLRFERILEAEDGKQAIEWIEQEHPEVILTDMMMPITNGIQLLEWINTHAPLSKTVVISGHDDFDFMRHTIKYGGMDYLLKPIDPDQLNDAVRKAIECWSNEEQSRVQIQNRNIEMNQIKPVYWDKIFSNLIMEPNYYYSVQDSISGTFNLSKSTGNCQIVILSMDTMERTVRNKFSAHMDLLYFTLTNICNEILSREQMGYAFRYWNSYNEIILLCWHNMDQVKRILMEINDGLYMTLHGRFDFGMGTPQLFPDDLGTSYKEARTALRSRNLLVKQNWLHEINSSERPKPNQLHLANYEEDLRLAVRSSQPERIEEAVLVFTNQVKQLESITIEQLELWWHEYNVFRSHWLNTYLPGQDMNTNWTSLGEAEKSNLIVPMDEHGKLSIQLWQQELIYGLNQLSQLIVRNMSKENNVIYEIVQYIDHHYQEEITLQDIASRFFLSREYISRKFKQEMKENLSDYIGRIRMEKAKLLLLNPNLRISQISEMVGYKDEKYFSKVFKKTLDISPNEYRKKAFAKVDT